MKFNIPKKWLADRIEEFGDNEPGGLMACSPELYEEMINAQKNITVIMLAGISGSGKSTYAAKLSEQIDAEIVCPDTLRKRITGDESNMSKDGYIWNQLVPLELRKALIYHTVVIFDSTACSIKSRKAIIKSIKDINLNYQIECHYIEPNIIIASEQNELRDRKVPNHVLHSQLAKWQVPTLEEGFSKIVKIN